MSHDNNKEIKLPSGAVLKVTLAPFKDGKNLYQAILRELKGLNLDPETELDTNFIKDIFCVSFTSKEIEAALQECFKRATYNGVKVTDECFEPEDARDDYFKVCIEVAKVNVLPFAKSLYADYASIFKTLTKDLV